MTIVNKFILKSISSYGKAILIRLSLLSFAFIKGLIAVGSRN